MEEERTCRRFHKDKFITYRDVDVEHTTTSLLVLKNGTKFDLNTQRFCFFRQAEYDKMEFEEDGWVTTYAEYYVVPLVRTLFDDEDAEYFWSARDGYPVVYPIDL